MQVVAFEVGILCVGLVGEELQKCNKMFLDVVHDLCLLVADVERSSGPISRGCQVRVYSLLGSVRVAYALVENEPALSAHELEHEGEQQYLGVDLSVFSLDYPPHLLVVHVEQLLHEFLVAL